MSSLVCAPVRDFPNELSLLLALVRSALGSQETPPPVDDIPTAPFAALVERHRLGAWLYHRTPASLAQRFPEAVRQHLKSVAASTSQRALVQAAELLRLVRALEAIGIEPLTVKGLTLAQQLHGGLGRRHVGDIDLLVRMPDVARADAVLQAAGLRRSRPEYALTPRQFGEYLRVKPEFEYIQPASRMRIELLWRPEIRPDAESLWTDAVPCPLGGHVLHTLAPEPNAIYLFQHGARHGWFRLFWLIDVALLLRSSAADWSRVIAQARQFRQERALLQGAALTEDLLGVARPAALRPAASEARSIAALVAEARRQIVRTPLPNEPMGEWTRQTIYRARLSRGARAKFAVLAPHLSSPLNWQTCPLPDRWFFLYRFAAPLLWLWRRLRRRSHAILPAPRQGTGGSF